MSILSAALMSAVCCVREQQKPKEERQSLRPFILSVPCSVLLSQSKLFSNTFNLSHIYTCVWSSVYMCICKCVCEYVALCVCDTQPSITSLESFRSRCAPIHTHSLCFDFSKSKDVNHLPPRVRAGEFIHTGARARQHAGPRARTHTRISDPSTSSSHSPPSLSCSPSSLPLSHSTI